MQRLLSIEEARSVLGIGRAKIYREINAGRLRVLKSGRRTLVRPEDVEAWVQGLSTYQPRPGHAGE